VGGFAVGVFSANPGEKRNQIRNPEKGCDGFAYCLTVADATPSGLDLLVLPFPRVGGLNPFGIPIPDLSAAPQLGFRWV
jgi:hypothetical protein